jgi:hypothetical protein
MRSFEFFNFLNPYSLTMALSLTQPLTEIRIRRYFSGGKARPALKAGNLTAICELIV